MASGIVVAAPVSAATLAVTVVSARQAITSNLVSVYSDGDCFIKFGDGTVVADNTGYFLPAGNLLFFDTSAMAIVPTYIAAIYSTANCNLRIGNFR